MRIVVNFSILVLDGESSDSLRLKSGDESLLTVLGEDRLVLWLLLELLDEGCCLVSLPGGLLSHGLLVISLASESCLLNFDFNGFRKTLFVVHCLLVELLSEFINVKLHVNALSVEVILHVLDSDHDFVLAIGVD